ncbi:fibronectin type III domain-containing protein [Halosimplex pelagicum]|uniref:Fibronectin type III domain-containing protein n=1 Tax=Halosimplex pelagicum TaxID=869886 RepID=A0A7D5TFY8_9EURY|nr:fibronectin type III domain-containing protein [Halosimplex pelagicum]QLH80996.1 fibronectin type III domain-containing protein [Halosimplex pelagicum]
MSVQFTTQLPDEDQPVLGNGVEDEIAVDRESAPANYGDIRIQTRETGQSSWDSGATGFVEQTIDHATVQTVIGGREDGEEYEVRLRTETEHVTGAWTAPVAIVTKFPGAANPVVDAVTTTSATVSWTDNADNEDGFYLQRRKRYDSGWGPWSTVVSVGPNVTQATDDTVQPAREYEFRIRAYTEDAEAFSGSVATTTPDAGLSQRSVSPTGWDVVVESTVRDAEREPLVLDDPQLQPTLNGQPRITIPVPRDESWSSDTWTDAEVTATVKGKPVPIEELEDVEHTPERTVLRCVGGIELENRVEMEVDQRPVHETAEDVAAEASDYQINVDDPNAETVADQLVQSAPTLSDYTQLASAPDTEPVDIGFDRVDRLASCFVGIEYDFEGNYESLTDGSPDPPHYIDGIAARITPGDALARQVQFSFTPDYRIPADRVGVAISAPVADGTFDIASNVTLNGSEIANIPAGAWGTYEESYSGGDLQAGEEYTLSIEVYGEDDAEAIIDGMAVYDTEYPPTGFDRPDELFDTIARPEPVPGGLAVTMDEVTPAVSVSGARVDADFDDTSGVQQLEVSNDQGTTWQTASNTESFETDFPDLGPTLQFRVTLGGYGSGRGRSPTTDYLAQSLTGHSLYADLDETPLVVNSHYNRSAKSILTELADRADAIWEVQFDQSADSIAFEWTQPGQRGTSDIGDVTTYTATKTTRERPEQVIVKGAGLPFEERFTASLGDWHDLGEIRLIPGSESVTDPDSGEQFERGADYSLDLLDGRIKPLSSGSMAGGTAYQVDYRRKAIAFETLPGASGGDITDLRVEPGPWDLPSLTTDQEAGLVARRIASELQEPLHEIEVEVTDISAYNLLEAVDSDVVPTDGPLKLQNVSSEPGSATLSWGSRETASDVVADIQAGLSQTNERV